MKAKVAVALALLAAAFLGGFVPQHLEVRRLRAELDAARAGLERSNAALRLDGLRRQIALALLETTRRNFGLARKHMIEFYRLADQQGRQELLAQRDSIMSRLATADVGVQPEIESILVRTFEIPTP